MHTAHTTCTTYTTFTGWIYQKDHKIRTSSTKFCVHLRAKWLNVIILKLTEIRIYMAHPMKQHMAVKNTPKTCQKLIPSFKLRHIVIETRRKIERKSDDERRSMKLLCSTYLKLIAAVFGAANVINFVNLANKIRFFSV